MGNSKKLATVASSSSLQQEHNKRASPQLSILRAQVETTRPHKQQTTNPPQKNNTLHQQNKLLLVCSIQTKTSSSKYSPTLFGTGLPIFPPPKQTHILFAVSTSKNFRITFHNGLMGRGSGYNTHRSNRSGK
mmetsp:Transcript_3050/g.4130  ORF Transcript_3050/g.4130 Transcript_3050/m.4130 type:complete len:132 (+) Transcript_3050:927-1322(+)